MKSNEHSNDQVRLDFLALFFLAGLRHCVRTVEQKDRDLLVGLLSDIHSAVNTGARFFPIDLSRRDLDSQALTTIAVLNRQEITA